MRPAKRPALVLAFALGTSVGRPARGEPHPTDAPAPAPSTPQAAPTREEVDRPPLGLFPTPRDALVDPAMARNWAALPRRFFVATIFDVGYVYARPRVAVGYGKPFTTFASVEANPIATNTGLGLYGGVRGAVPYLDLRIGARQFWAFSHTYLPPADSYQRIELETRGGERARYLTWEAETDATIPLGPGHVLVRGSASYITGVPDGRNVFEETLHVIVAPPFVWRARGGYALSFGPRGQHSLGLVVDVLDVPKRDDSITLRVGPIVRFVLSRRVEVRGNFVATVVSPDAIGLVGGDFTELGVRYRWATE